MIVGVIGSGAIGPDLAYGFMTALSREAGSKVYLVDIKQEALDAGASRIEGYVQKGIARGKISAAAGKATLALLVPTRELASLADCDYVLEAASEDLDVKRKILRSLEAIVKPDCLIGFATSGLPRHAIARDAEHEGRCFVNHPFYPAWRSLPIEVVLSTNKALGRRMMATIEKLGRVPIETADVECFAADDVFCNYIAEAARIVEEGVATPAQVDAIVHAAIGGGGPFNVMDLTKGNHLVHKCQKLMEHADTGTPWFAPPGILEKQGDAPWHDRKAPGDPKHDASLAERVMDRVLAVLLARTYFLIENDVCKPTETNWLMRMALGFTKGTLEIGADLGADRVRELCVRHAEAFPGFVVPKLVLDKKLPAFAANVLTEIEGGIATVRVFRPEVKNALSKLTLVEIDRAVTALQADDAVNGIVITSYDGSLAGADIQELAALKSADDCRTTCLSSHPIFERIAHSKKPIVAAVDGAVLGGGAELSSACHARVVGKNLVLGQPEVKLGIIPGYGGTQRLPRLIGLARAVELLRTAKTATAKEACEWGWAHGEPEASPLTAAKALLAKVIAGEAKLTPMDEAPMTVPEKLGHADLGQLSLAIDAILVDVLHRGLAQPLAKGLEVEADGFARCKQTVDMDVGMKNFIQNGPRVPAAFFHE